LCTHNGKKISISLVGGRAVGAALGTAFAGVPPPARALGLVFDQTDGRGCFIIGVDRSPAFLLGRACRTLHEAERVRAKRAERSEARACLSSAVLQRGLLQASALRHSHPSATDYGPAGRVGPVDPRKEHTNTRFRPREGRNTQPAAPRSVSAATAAVRRGAQRSHLFEL
jgi:hypothetical protein